MSSSDKTDDGGGGSGSSSKSDVRGFKAVNQVDRRQWDTEEYAKKAQERAERGSDEEEESVADRITRKKQEFEKAEQGAIGPAGSARSYLHHRREDVDLKSKLNKSNLVTSAMAQTAAGGYFCDVCQCVLKDSMAYLDHINGKKHQRTLGFSMRVERSTTQQVKDRLEAGNRRKEEEEARRKRPKISSEEDELKAYEEKLKRAEEEEEKRVQAIKDARKAAKKSKKGGGGGAKEKERGGGGGGEEEEGGEEDSAMMAMMGFGGFGGGKK